VLADEMARARVDRDEWRKRVERWKASGLTAKEFAAEVGINAGTLQFWQHKLKTCGPIARRPRRRRTDAIVASSLVELRAPVAAALDQRFEVELGNGRRVRVSAGFDADALKRLLVVLEAA
jgi:transposase